MSQIKFCLPWSKPLQPQTFFAGMCNPSSCLKNSEHGNTATLNHTKKTSISCTSPASSSQITNSHHNGASTSDMPRSHLTCLHFVLMSREPGASVFSPAGVWTLLCREVFLTLSCTDAVPHVGGSLGAPKGGLSSHHPVTLHQCSSSLDRPTVSPAPRH